MIERIDAILTVKFSTSERAKMVKFSLDPDNVIPPPTRILTVARENDVIIEMMDVPSLGTLENLLVEFIDHLQMELELDQKL